MILKKIKFPVIRAWISHPIAHFLVLLILIYIIRHALIKKEQVNISIPPGKERVCLSLRVLKERAETAAANGLPLPPECDDLCGLNYLEGFFTDDRDGPDIILVGLRDTNRPALYLNDLLVNIRNQWSGSNAPRCSLDPIKQDVVRFEKSWRAILTQSNLTTAETIACLSNNVGPQTVVIEGVPKDSHHAHVMIDADYHMKKLSQGHVLLPGINSCLRLSEMRDHALESRGIKNQTSESQSRFWFQIGKEGLLYVVDDGVTWLKKCKVEVATEKQAATSDGELYDVHEDDPIAITFATNLSDAMPRLASGVVPEYASLEDLYRLRAILISIQSSAESTAHRLGLEHMLSGYRYLHGYYMPPSLPGLINYHDEVATNGTDDGVLIAQRLRTVCGGVSMNMNINKQDFHFCADKILRTLFTQSLSARPNSLSLAWVVPAH